MSKPNILKDKGAAILTALLIVAIASAISTMLILRERIAIQRTSLIINADKMYLYTQLSVAEAQAYLIHSLKKNRTHLKAEIWPHHLNQIKIPDGVVETTIEDEEAKFNVNNLQNKIYQSRFLKLLRTILHDDDTDKLKKLSDALAAWIAPNPSPTFDSIYQNLNPPYNSAHRPLVSISELRLVDGFSQKMFNKLQPYLAALPGTTPININSASATVMTCLGDAIGEDLTKQLVLYRQEHEGFKTLAEFTGYPGISNYNLQENDITLYSDFFMIHTEIKLDRQDLHIYSLVKRQLTNQQPSVTVLWESRGAF